MAQIWIWELEPYEPNRKCRDFEALRNEVTRRGLPHPIPVDRVPGGYRPTTSRWRLLAARAVGILRISVHVSTNPCGEIPLDEEWESGPLT